VPATPKHKTDTTTQSWDGPGQVKNLDPPLTKSTGNKVFAWRDPDKDLTTKDAWSFPHHQVNGDGDPGDANVKGCQSAVGVLNGAMGGADIPDGDVQAVYNHVAAHLKDAGVEVAPLKRSDDDEGETRSAVHEAFDGTHSHAHTANGQQGDDATHEHEHTHAGDASHAHSHADRSLPPAGSTRAAGDGAVAPCPSCTTPNDPDADVCVNCGGELDQNGPDEDTDGERDIDLLIADDSAADMEGNPIDPGEVFGAGAGRAAALKDVAVIRSRIGKGLNIRDADPANPGSGTLMFGYFSTFNEWYEIDSFFEGSFLERVAPGAYKDTIKNDLPGMRVLFDHGFDPELGNKPLGPITVLREDDTGAYYEVPLLDTSYNRDFVLPALQGRTMSGQMHGSLLGASMRFIVLDEEWDRTEKITRDNPRGLPLRTITTAQVLEFGAVTFPANVGATSGVRSGTDDFIDHLHHDQRFVARLAERTGPAVVERMLDTMRWDPGMARNTRQAQEGRDPASERVSKLRRRAAVALRT
jgi:HK97 family phage prohead protease